MFRALFLKEIREIWWLGLPVLCVMLYGMATEISFGPLSRGQGYGFRRILEPEQYQSVPLLDGSFAQLVLLWGGILAAILGLWQSMRETQQKTWPFLLFRPISRGTILWAKILAAALVLIVAVCLPAVLIVLWAATPGTHASPFFLTLTIPIWYALSVCVVIYFSSLFAGLRQGHWLGTRWWPLLSTSVIFGFGAVIFPKSFTTWMWLLLIVSTLFVYYADRDEVHATDFS